MVARTSVVSPIVPPPKGELQGNQNLIRLYGPPGCSVSPCRLQSQTHRTLRPKLTTDLQRERERERERDGELVIREVRGDVSLPLQHKDPRRRVV